MSDNFQQRGGSPWGTPPGGGNGNGSGRGVKIIKFTKKIAIANKESIICGWPIIKKELIKYDTKFIPVDSEHFSLFKLLKNKKKSSINKIIITASGGPFLKKVKKI